MNPSATKSISTVFAMALAAIPTVGCTQPAPAELNTTKLAIIETSGSSERTDLFATAQNKVTELVTNMPVGGTVAVRAMNSDVTALCTDVIFTLPREANTARQQRARQVNESAVAVKIPELIACSTKHSTATELFGGLGEAFRAYSTATEAWVFSDLCENATIGPICTRKRLANPSAIAEAVPDENTPKLSAAFHVIYVGAGRGSKLDAGSVENLRKAVGLWTSRTGATFEFANA